MKKKRAMRKGVNGRTDRPSLGPGDKAAARRSVLGWPTEIDIQSLYRALSAYRYKLETARPSAVRIPTPAIGKFYIGSARRLGAPERGLTRLKWAAGRQLVDEQWGRRSPVRPRGRPRTQGHSDSVWLRAQASSDAELLSQRSRQWSATIAHAVLAAGPPSLHAFTVVDRESRVALAIQADTVVRLDRLTLALERLRRSRGAARGVGIDDPCPIPIDRLWRWCARAGTHFPVRRPSHQQAGSGGADR